MNYKQEGVPKPKTPLVRSPSLDEANFSASFGDFETDNKFFDEDSAKTFLGSEESCQVFINHDDEGDESFGRFWMIVT